MHVVGNTVVDALFHVRDHLLPRLAPDPLLAELQARDHRLVLVTGHRRESFGDDFAAICAGLRRLAAAFPAVTFVYPVHPNPHVRKGVDTHLRGTANVRLVDPVSYVPFVRLMLHAALIITDSGGIQEEATALGVPVLVTRRTCERLEAVEAGVAQLVGPDPDAIVAAGTALLGDAAHHRARAVPSTVFGDGQASARIARVLGDYRRT